MHLRVAPEERPQACARRRLPGPHCPRDRSFPDSGSPPHVHTSAPYPVHVGALPHTLNCQPPKAPPSANPSLTQCLLRKRITSLGPLPTAALARLVDPSWLRASARGTLISDSLSLKWRTRLSRELPFDAPAKSPTVSPVTGKHPTVPPSDPMGNRDGGRSHTQGKRL